jgi:Transposase zinc-binding domain
MALPSGPYAPRDPAASILYQVVRDHYHTFRAEASQLREGERLPRYVDDEFDAFLRCGWHAGGFARFRCTGCRAEWLLAFSCKGRGFCPSCGGRRMTERAAHLVDHIWPEVPVRQWVLTLPPRVRYALAWRHDLCTAVAGVLFRAVQRHLLRAPRLDPTRTLAIGGTGTPTRPASVLSSEAGTPTPPPARSTWCSTGPRPCAARGLPSRDRHWVNASQLLGGEHAGCAGRHLPCDRGESPANPGEMV